jgi:peptidoglycan/LPS O-acetylase OafA/YrhL
MTSNLVSVNRILWLDVIRACAVLLVLMRHCEYRPPQHWPIWLQKLMTTTMQGGWVGVDLFFVLSGFLVSGLIFGRIQRHQSVSTGRFLIRRAWKIYPPFYVLFFVTCLLNLRIHAPYTTENYYSELLFLQSYLPGMWAHTWSLAVEEHFYLLFAILVCSFVRWHGLRDLKSWPIFSMTVAICFVELLMRVLARRDTTQFDTYRHFFPTHLRLDSLFVGVCLSFLLHTRHEHFVSTCHPWRFVLILTGVLGLLPAFFYQLETSWFLPTIGLTLFALASASLIAGICLLPQPKSRFIELLAVIGAASYSIYLWHLPFQSWCLPVLQQRITGPLGDTSGMLIYLGGSIVVGMVMAWIVERPALLLRDRCFPTGIRPLVIETGQS